MLDTGAVAVTASSGLVLDDGRTDLSGLIALADTALYRAKAEGRNRLVAVPTPAQGIRLSPPAPGACKLGHICLVTSAAAHRRGGQEHSQGNHARCNDTISRGPGCWSAC